MAVEEEGGIGCGGACSSMSERMRGLVWETSGVGLEVVGRGILID